MNGLKLKYNPDKTGFIIIGDKHTRESVTCTKCSVSFLQSSALFGFNIACNSLDRSYIDVAERAEETCTK